jgi:hypothetical protein
MADKTDTAQAGPDETGKTEELSIEDRLGKLEKVNLEYKAALDEAKKESAGKDRRITEQNNTIKELQKTTLSKDELLSLREKELADKEVAIEAKNAAERQELEMLRLKMLKQETLGKLNVPPLLWEFIEGTTADEIETRARKLINVVSKEQVLKDNARKVTGIPRTGTVSKHDSLSVQDIREMDSRAATDAISRMSKEDREKLFNESLE